VLNAANEIAVELFLHHAVRFTDIPALIEYAMEKAHNTASPSLEDICAADAWTRAFLGKQYREAVTD